jgi:hypothetical protein
MRRLWTVFLIFAGCWLCLEVFARSAQEPVPVPVPVRKVVLYKNGMGYFEHLGPVTGQQVVEISLPRAQMNDMLKSLTVIDMGGSQVSSVTYDSAAPLERRLGELPVDLSASQNLVGFLNQVRGAEVRIQAPSGPVAGRLMGAEMRERQAGTGATVQTVEATVLSPSGELKIVELASAASLQFAEPAFAADLFRYLDLLSTRHERDVRRLRIQTAGSGERQIYVSYTSEAPIWKTTYRLVLDENRKPLLQGWAIVDNTTPMDWVNVTLSLVAGAPVSFVQNLSQPIYARRPVVPLPAGVQVQPQLHEGTLTAISGETAIRGTVRDPSGSPIPGVSITVVDMSGNEAARSVTAGDGSYGVTVASGTYRLEASMTGFRDTEVQDIQVAQGRVTALDLSMQIGGVSETVTVQAGAMAARGGRGGGAGRASGMLALAPPASPTEVPKAADLIRRQPVQAAQAQELGEQFEYQLRQPVTIRRNESGLLPIVHAEVDGEKVSLFNGSMGEKRPRLAVWIKNTSGLTLDAGSFTVIDSNAFAGEGLVDTIQPGESRLLSYALDLGVEVAANTDTERQRVERVEISHGILRMHSRMTERRTYVVRNNDQKLRSIILEHPVRSGWSLVQTQAPAESSASYYRFRLEAKPKSTVEFTVREETPQETTYSITNISAELIALWLKERSIDAEIEKALSTIVAKKAEISDLAQKISELDQEQASIFRDQERLRANLQRLGNSPEEASLRQRYIRQLDGQENRLGAIKIDRDELESTRAAAQKQLDEMIQNLTFDRKLAPGSDSSN